jgi:dipeptidyl aminopeptidase/acylaminoacyl peptidase
VQTQQLHDALSAQGDHVEMELYPRASHADTIQGFSAFRRSRAPTLERVLRFLREVMPGQDTPAS